MLSEGQILGGKWKIKSLVGEGNASFDEFGVLFIFCHEGACAKVYSVEHIDNNKKYDYPLVAKCIEYGKGFSKSALKEQEKISSTLNRERIVLAPGQFLTQFKYRPRIPGLDFYGKDETLGVVYLVLEQLNMNLKELSETISSSVFSIGSIGLQLLDGLQWLHMNGWLFIDIKPENFMFRENDNIVFIDCKIIKLIFFIHLIFCCCD
jgi:serine/threonine protein kinase